MKIKELLTQEARSAWEDQADEDPTLTVDNLERIKPNSSLAHTCRSFDLTYKLVSSDAKNDSYSYKFIGSRTNLERFINDQWFMAVATKLIKQIKEARSAWEDQKEGRRSTKTLYVGDRVRFFDDSVTQLIGTIFLAFRKNSEIPPGLHAYESYDRVGGPIPHERQQQDINYNDCYIINATIDDGGELNKVIRPIWVPRSKFMRISFVRGKKDEG